MPKGHAKVGGRQKGSPNKRTTDALALAAKVIDNPEYQRTLLDRAHEHTLPPAMEVLLWHYRFGKPAEASRDDQAFMNDLLQVVLQHVDSSEGKRAIREVLDAYAGGPALPALRRVS